MAIILNPKQKRKSYEIVDKLSSGAFAIAYKAKQPSGEMVFFKQYKSPTPMVPWYARFVDHQNEIKRRIESDPAARDRCYRFVEFFEFVKPLPGGPCCVSTARSSSLLKAGWT